MLCVNVMYLRDIFTDFLSSFSLEWEMSECLLLLVFFVCSFVLCCFVFKEPVVVASVFFFYLLSMASFV